MPNVKKQANYWLRERKHISNHTYPTESAYYFTKKIAVANRNGDSDSLFLLTAQTRQKTQIWEQLAK